MRHSPHTSIDLVDGEIGGYSSASKKLFLLVGTVSLLLCMRTQVSKATGPFDRNGRVGCIIPLLLGSAGQCGYTAGGNLEEHLVSSFVGLIHLTALAPFP